MKEGEENQKFRLLGGGQPVVAARLGGGTRSLVGKPDGRVSVFGARKLVTSA